MNERIRKITEQAIQEVDNPYPGNPLNAELEKMYIPDCFAEKFAELIVKECADIAKNYAGGSMPVSISLAIKSKFGVK